MASYIPHDVCSRRIDFDIDNENKVRNVSFEGGCSGNALGVSRLVEGRDADEIIALLSGTPCGKRDTSCPDQLAQALAENLQARG